MDAWPNGYKPAKPPTSPETESENVSSGLAGRPKMVGSRWVHVLQNMSIERTPTRRSGTVHRGDVELSDHVHQVTRTDDVAPTGMSGHRGSC